jgi:hypothetical protein
MTARTKIAGAVAAGLTATVLGALPALAQTSSPEPPPAAEAAPATTDPQLVDGELLRTYDAFDANQGIAVDGRYFYAVDNRSITKHDRTSGEPLLQFAGHADGPIEHLDSGVVLDDGKLYAAHSNYPEWPMESSVEIFDTRTMEHVGTHSFGIFRGSLTWLDRHDGAWWAAFANYDRVQSGQTEPYGRTYTTQVVKMDDGFQVEQSWTIPKVILDRFDVMSNSGGSWGPDGRLYLTGHDLPEAYVMEVPTAGAELEWVATVRLPGIEGQGIAWDDDGPLSTLWGISREHSQAVQFSVPVDDVVDPDVTPWDVLGPGEFQR